MSGTTATDPRKLDKTSTPGIYKRVTPGMDKRGARYVVRYRDPAGKDRKKLARTLAEARVLQAQLVSDVSRGEWMPLKRVAFDDYARSWIATYNGRTSSGIRESTLVEYRRALGLTEAGERRADGIGAVPHFGAQFLAAIAPRDVKAWLRGLSEAGASPSTVRTYLAPLRALFADAVEEGLIRANPAAGLRLPRPTVREDETEERTKALTEKELRALVLAAPKEWKLLVRFLAATGLRLGEALAVRWDDVDLGRQRVKVRRRLYRGTLAPPKSRYGRRDVPLAPGLARELWPLRTKAAANALLFHGDGGRPLDASTVYRAVKSAAKAAGVPWAGPHALRHTCATMLFRHGLNAKQVQLWLGHHSPAFTLATYVHLLPDDLPDVAFLDELMTARGADAEEAESFPSDDERMDASHGRLFASGSAKIGR